MENFNQYQKDQYAKQLEINKRIFNRVVSLAMKKELHVHINSNCKSINVFDSEFKTNLNSYFEGVLTCVSNEYTITLTELYNEIKKL